MTVTRKVWNTLIALLWLSLPAVALRYWLVWDQLPARMATHFNASGRANGWTPVESSLSFSLVFLAIVLAVATVLLMRFRKAGAPSYALLGVFYVVVAVFTYMEYAIVGYNLDGTPIHFTAIILPIPIVVAIAAVVFLASKRGSSFPSTAILAEEVHASHLWGIVLTAPLAILLALSLSRSNFGVRLSLGVVGLVMLGAAAMAWSGFHYLFTSAGVEIRTLGFRLLTIPKEHIRSYAVGNWSVAGGYGIRGIGDYRAYVWCNKGVRIKTNSGDVFLGHSEPDRIVHDLDLIQQFAH